MYSENAALLVDKILEMTDTSYSKASTMINRDGNPVTRQSFFRMAKEGTMRLSVFLELIDALGLKISIEEK